MKRQILFLFAALILVGLPKLEALKRDQYFYPPDTMDPHCVNHITQLQLDCALLTKDLAQLLPSNGRRCIWEEYRNGDYYDVNCPNRAVYSGYIEPEFFKYSHHLKRHLEYCKKNTNCKCFWPEYSDAAGQISDSACFHFKKILKSSALKGLESNYNEQKEFGVTNYDWLGFNGLMSSLISKQLHFMDYYNVCKDIEDYSISKYSENEAAEIKEMLDDILEVLYPQFLDLNLACFSKHPSPEIYQEIVFMKLLVNNELDIQKNFNLNKVSNSQCYFENYFKGIDIKGVDSITLSQNLTEYNYYDLTYLMHQEGLPSSNPLQSDIFLEYGTMLNNHLLHKEAIQILTQSIQLNPLSKNSYIERALAYFETNQLTLALKDYESAKNLTITPPFKFEGKNAAFQAQMYVPENKLDFSAGLVSGTVDGAKLSVVEFIPSIFSSCRGILNGLWAFACSPIEVSHEMANAAYAIGEFISVHSTEECFQFVVPELKELSLLWNELNDHSRGQKIGFIIGKYGIDIFAPIGTLKGINKVKALKRANTMCTLENCAASQAKQFIILDKSIIHATSRQSVITRCAKKGGILVRNSNTQVHIMQPKHAWDKVIKLTGNAQMDCNNVVKLLEKNKIYMEKYRKATITRPEFIRYDHQMKVNGYDVYAIFNKNPETGEVFLNDAWVITK